jgi:GNAT superfamily N-acetyltransferase
MQPRNGERAASLDLARDAGVVERALGLERDHRGLGIGLVALLDRRLQRAQSGSVHGQTFPANSMKK